MSTILVVDDDASTRSSAEGALSAAAHQCSSTASVEEARSILAREPTVDAVVIEVASAEGATAELVHWLLETSPDTALVMTSDQDDEQSLETASRLGVHGYLLKPFAPSMLVATVTATLQQLSLRRTHLARSKELESLLDERDRALRKITSTLRFRDSQLMSLVSSVPVGVLYSTAEGGCEYANEEAQRLTGFDLNGFLGAGWFNIIHPEDRGIVLSHLEQCRDFDQRSSFEHRLVCADGTKIHVSTRLGPVHDEHGNSGGYVATIEDITARRQAEQDLEWQATHDPLTGLPNRALINERIAERVSTGQGLVVLIDLDGFKVVNDIHGHGAGDRLLIDVAEELKSEFEPGFVVGRFGGDEFVIVSDDDREDRPHLSARVLAALSSAAGETGALPITASVGIATVTHDSTTDELVRQADIAMYRAKTRGGARHQVFTPAMSDRLVERFGLEDALRQAVREGQLEVHYQPEVDCRTGALQRVESLIRWPHPERGMLPPGLFLPLAVELGLMDDLTELVVRRSLKAMTFWADITPASQTVPVAINLGAMVLEGDAFFPMFAAALDEFDVDPGLITIEVTEESLMSDLGNSAFRLDAIRDLGARISLDDFGTGYSSLSYLNDLPLDQLKIDRTFVQRLGTASNGPNLSERKSRQLVEAIIHLANIFHLEVVAEGVEDQAQYAAVTELGCDLAQGFLIAEPAPHDDPWLRQLVAGALFQPESERPAAIMSESVRR